MLRVLIADDHPLVRDTLARILSIESDIEVISSARDDAQTIKRTFELKPDIILTDVSVPRCGSPEAIVKIKDSQPSVRILVVTLSELDEGLFLAFRYGAQGYLLKTATVKELVDCVRKTASGQAIISQQLLMRLIRDFQGKPDYRYEPSGLELDILASIKKGLTFGQICSSLSISQSELMTCIHSFLGEFQAQNRRMFMANSTPRDPTLPELCS